MNAHTEPTFSIDHDVVEALQATAMLIRLTTSSFGTQVTHRERSQDVTNDAQAAPDAARVIVNRLPGAAKMHHQRVTKHQSHAREAIASLTTPWDESGWRLLMTTNFERLAKALHPINEEFKSALEAYRLAAPTVLKQAEQEMGTLGANISMPTPEVLVGAYSMSTEIIPIPDGATFRGLPPNVREVLGNRVQKQINASYERGVSAIMNRLQPLLATTVDRLASYEDRLQKQAQGVDVGRHGAFRDSLITNFEPILDVLAALDVAGDSRIKELATRVKAIVAHTPGELREDDAARADVKQEASEILDLLNQWGV